MTHGSQIKLCPGYLALTFLCDFMLWFVDNRLLISKHGISIILRNVIIEDSEHWYVMYNIIMPLRFLVAHILLLNVAQSFRNGL